MALNRTKLAVYWNAPTTMNCKAPLVSASARQPSVASVAATIECNIHSEQSQ